MFRRRLILIIFLLVLIGLLVFEGFRGGLLRIVSPLTYLAEETASKIASPFKTLTDLNELASQNKQLEEENLALKAEIAHLKEIETEAQLLKRELKFNESLKKDEFLITKVLGRSPIGVSGSWLLNRGKKDGIKPSSLVISEGYLVGKIKNVFERGSLLELVTSHRVLIPVVLTQSRANGLLRGGLQGMVVEEIPLDIKVEIGEDVVTQGLDEEYPEGILVGKVREVQVEKGAIFQKVLVETPLKFSQIEVVSIVK